MKNQRRKNENNFLIGTLCAIIVLLAIALIVVLAKYPKESDEQEENIKNPVSSVEQQMQNEKAMKIKTKYGNLYYPQKWEENLRTKIVEEDEYTVKFYGMVEGKEEQHLFSIVFGEQGDKLGSFEKDGETVNVCVTFEELTINDEWTDTEKNMIYTMQEDINYLISMWEKEGGFTIGK